MSGVFDSTFTEVNSVLSSFVNGFSSQVINTISPLVFIGLVLYFIWVGISYIKGFSDDTLSDIAWHIFRVGIIVGIAVNVGAYQTYIINSIMTVPDTIVATLLGGTSANGASGGALSTLLDKIFFDGFDLAGKYWDEASFSLTDMNLQPLIAAIFVVIGTVLCLLVAGFWLFATKILISLLLGVGSIFIIALIWQPTKHYFSSWANTLFALILVNVFICAVFSIFSGIFDSQLTNLNPSDATAKHFTDTGALLILGAITFGVLLLVPSFTFQLTGGASSLASTFGATSSVASAGATAAASGAKSAATGAAAAATGAKSAATGAAAAGRKGIAAVKSYYKK